MIQTDKEKQRFFIFSASFSANADHPTPSFLCLSQSTQHKEMKLFFFFVLILFASYFLSFSSSFFVVVAGGTVQNEKNQHFNYPLKIILMLFLSQILV